MKKTLLLIAFSMPAIGQTVQEHPHQPINMVEDWTSHHLIFTENVPPALEDKILSHPRFWQQYYRRHFNHSLPDENTPDILERTEPIGFQPTRNQPVRPQPMRNTLQSDEERDWNISLGSGNTVSVTSSPAKFTFDVTAPPSCTADFLVTGIGITGSSTQANLIGVNNLYTNAAGTGFCSGTAPKILFSYDVGGSVQITSSVVMSFDGKKVAFVDSNPSTGVSRFHVLTFQTASGNGTSVSAPAVPGTGNTATDQVIAFTVGSTTTPFVDYVDDVAYVSSNDTANTTSVLHKITPVFNGTPAEVTTGGWPKTISTSATVSTPVYDSVTKRVFFTDSAGNIDYVDTTVNPVTLKSLAFYTGANRANVPVIVDSSIGKVYAFSGNANNILAAQSDTNLSSVVTVTVGTGTPTGSFTLPGAFNNAYYNGTSASAQMYVVGNDKASTPHPALYSIGFNSSFALNTATANGPLALTAASTSGVNPSPLVEFFNATTNKDFLFLSVTNNCSTAITGGCVRAIDITSGFPTTTTLNNVVFAASGGTGGLTVDNNSASPQAANVFYSTLTGSTLVKATQSGLQ